MKEVTHFALLYSLFSDQFLCCQEKFHYEFVSEVLGYQLMDMLYQVLFLLFIKRLADDNLLK